MSILNRITGWFCTRVGGKSELQKNAEKALQMKRDAGPDTNIPEHQTSHEVV